MIQYELGAHWFTTIAGSHVAFYLCCTQTGHGSHWDWKSGKTWKNGKAFSSQGKVREFCQDWKSQGILLKILEKLKQITLEN